METVNDCFIVIGTYHLILFSDYCLNPEIQFLAGYSLFMFMVALIIFNVTKTAYKSLMAQLRKREIIRKMVTEQKRILEEIEIENQRKKDHGIQKIGNSY